MRLAFVVAFVAILGGVLGVARTWSEFSGVEERLELSSSVTVDGSGDVTASEDKPEEIVGTTGVSRAIVEGEPSHDFGVLKRDQSKSCSFVVRNEGDADLLIEKQNVSCSLCVETQFTNATVKPGEEVTIPVSLKARKLGPELSEALEVRTNDKSHSVIRFELIAYISEAAGASVSELSLGTIYTDEASSASFRIYGFNEQQLEIIECKMMDSDNQECFEWQISELSAEAVKAGQAHAVFGKEIKVDIKPGLPVGPLKQQFTIVARAGEEITIDVPVVGQVTGDLSIIGGSTYSPDKSVLSLGRILVGEGASAKLHVMVKGDHHEDIQVTVGECEPAEYLSVTIGERKAMKSGKASLVPVVVEVSKDAPAANHLGGTGSGLGKIVLHTTHPTAKEVTLYVRFAVE